MNELNNCNTVLINNNGNQYAFDFINYEILKLSESQKEIFIKLMKDKTIPYNSSIQQDLIPIILKIKSGLFFTKNPIKLYADGGEKNSGIISFPVVHSCNLNCKYCYAKSGSTYRGTNKYFQIDTINMVYSYFTNLLVKPVENIRLEFVSGGETLIDQDLFKNIVNHISKLAVKDNINLEIFALTNGTLLNEGIIDFLNKSNSMLGISIDGPARIHDYQRPFMNGKGTYDVILNNISKVTSGKWKSNIWAVSVITSATDSLVEILNHHKSLGIKSMEMRIVRGEDKYSLSVSDKNIEHFKRIYYDFSEYLKQHPDSLNFIINNYDTFGKLIKRLLVGEKVIYRCQAGKTKFSFTADGDIYPCDSFVGNDEFKIGNIFDGWQNDEVIARFYNMNVSQIPECKICEFRYLCGGDCYYNRFYNEQNQVYCKLQKYLCILAIDLIYHIKNSDTATYSKLVSFAKLRDILK